MNTQTTKRSPVKGIVRAKLNEGFVLRLESNETCFVPIKNLIGYTNPDRYERYDLLDKGDVMEVIIGSDSRRPMASEVHALEYRAEHTLCRGASVEFYVVNATEAGVAVRLLSPEPAVGQSAYIHRTRLDDETFEVLLHDVMKAAEERVGRYGHVVSIRRNEKERLSVKLTCSLADEDSFE
jgi:hypothetical protein